MNAEKLIADLSDLLVATADEEKARKEYDGYSWDYHGSSLIIARQKAADVFTNSLNEYIDDRIEAATGTRP